MPRHPACAPLPRLVLMALLGALTLTGCARWTAPDIARPELPSRIDAALRDSQSREAAYREIFPPLPKCHVAGTLVARSRLWPGADYFQFRLLATGGRRLRLNATSPQGRPLFDLISNPPAFDVLLHPDELWFRGALADDEPSPYGEHYGFEPWELVEALQLGQWLARTGFETRRDWLGRLSLQPADGATGQGPIRIRAASDSGLPAFAVWQRGGRKLTVYYRAWHWAESEPGRVLLPRKIEIHVDRPRVNLVLEIERAWTDDRIPSTIFEPRTGRPYRQLPLEALGEALADS